MKNKRRLLQNPWIPFGSAEDVEIPSRLRIRRKYVLAAKRIVFLKMSVVILPTAVVPAISTLDCRFKEMARAL